MKKKVLIALLIFYCCFNFFAQTNNIEKSLWSIADNMSSWVQENTLALNMTSEAFIGQVIPSIPPHFQIGISADTAIVDMSPINAAATEIKNANPNLAAAFPTLPKVFVMPTHSVNLRIGGYYLPFDVGVFGTFMVPPQGVEIKHKNLTTSAKEIANVGADIRIAVLQGKNMWPKISVGVGYFYNNQKYGFSATADGNQETAINMHLRMHTFYAQLHVSKQFSFAVPFIGVKAALSRTENLWEYSVGVKDDKITRISNRAIKTFDIKEIQPQIFTGVGFLLPYSQITVGGTYNPRRNLWTVSIHGGFKL